MNQRFGKAGMKAAAFLLSAAVWMGSMVPVCAAENTDETKSKEDTKTSSDKEKNEAKDVGKDETVYVKLKPDGTKKEVIVSDWLKNPDGTKSIEDASDLSDIKNVKGDETYAVSDDGLLWESGGNDIYYQGTSDKELPISMKISYFLDGKEISPEEIAGKSGKVTIRYEYENNAISKAVVDGKEETITTPFAVVTGVILPGDHFKNVTVSGGRVISDGTNNIVAGMVFPGLGDSLNLTDSELTKDIKLPETIEITADAEDFQIDLSATVVTSSIFDELGLGDIDSVDELTNALNELSDASTQLVDGSGKLLDGVTELKDASGEFASGIDTLYEKSGELADGLTTLDQSTGTLTDGLNQLNGQKQTFSDGVQALLDGVTKLENGAGSLQEGVGQYTAGADTLADGVLSYTEGANQVASGAEAYVAGVGALDEGIGTLASSAATLPEAIGKVNAGAQALKAGAGQLPDDETAEALKQAGTAVTNGVKSMHDNITALLEALNKTGDSDSAAAMVELVAQTMQTLLTNDTSVLQLLNDAASIQASIDSVKGLAPQSIQNKVDSVESEYAGRLQDAIGLLETNITMENAVIEQLKGFSGGSQDLEQLKTALQAMADKTDPAKADSLYAGAAALSAGTSALLDGTAALKPGIDALADGTQQLADGTAGLPDGIKALTDGSSALVENGKTLSDGAKAVARASGQLNAGAKALTSQSGALNDGAAALLGGVTELSGGLYTLSGGVAELSDGVAALAAGGAKLKAGTKQLADGGSQLVEGVGTLKDGGSQLTDGVNALYDGAKELADGMKEFDTDGIQKLKSTVDDEFSGMIDRMQAVIDTGRDYQTFTKLADGTKGSVKFIIETEAIKAE